MKTIQVTAYGDIDVLRPVDAPRPAAGPGEVVVKVEYAGVNFLDVQVRRGMYGIPTPFTAGFEGAGVITETGRDVAGLALGQRVVWANVLGAYAEYAVVPAAQAIAVPEALGLETAVAVQVQGITAQYLVTDVHPVGAGEVVVVHAAAGGVGRFLTQLAKARGAVVIGTASSPEKAEVARSVGADHVLEYTGFADRVRELTEGRGADVVYDGVGVETFEESVRALRPRGSLAIYGESSGPVPAFNSNEFGGQSVTISRPSFADFTRTREEVQDRVDDVHAKLLAGTLSVDVNTISTLGEAAEAQRLLQDRLTVGKLLLKVS
ncbi:quinone oxidoreductase [Streptomyces antioxidans]|uniref:Quinone oxidoreductase n=1 Tax=Streptomyces antioxidans TaxID=1507734 RepID=A0A1V4DBX4_9ACTN|nr:quinone oxidoreductase [Streptomyces antioxidans]OPF83842.1 quinone oxidoreductase [Streptomyces antioxidans]